MKLFALPGKHSGKLYSARWWTQGTDLLGDPNCRRPFWYGLAWLCRRAMRRAASTRLWDVQVLDSAAYEQKPEHVNHLDTMKTRIMTNK